MPLFQHKFRAMASIAEVRLYAAESGYAQGAFGAIQREVERVEAKFSRYRAESAISVINRRAGRDPVGIDAETSALLDYADACWRQSGGLFDITSGVLRTVWDFKRGVPPDQASIDRVLERIGWKRVRREANAVALEAGMEIDFGGIGKEYAADRAMAAAREAGIVHGFVNLGGDIRVIGPQEDGRPWRVGIAHPRDPERTIAQVELTEGGLATSGDYERFFDYEGRRYCHLLNPLTGWPVDGAQSVSAFAPLCTLAGSCATIAMLNGNGASDFLSAQGFPWLLIDREGQVSGVMQGEGSG
ncbi:MAG: FAD:protein FMN transferase [Casimicrobiaceae bacterium]